MPLASFRVGQTSSENGEDDKAGKSQKDSAPHMNCIMTVTTATARPFFT